MAQVTISGNVTARHDTTQTTASNKASGFLIGDAQVNFAATEDLGGGLKATARFTIDGATSDGGTKPPLSTAEQTGTINRDCVDLSLAGGFGSVTFSSRDSSDYLGVDLITDDLKGSGTFTYNGGVQDRVTYTSPTISGVRFTATMQDGDVGTAATHTQRTNVFEIDYAAGPLTANIGMLNADKSTHTGTDGFTRFKVGYNLGVAAVSFGQINAKDAAGVKDTATAISVSVPMGALTLAASQATIKDGPAAKRDGTAISATYALSKRTSLFVEKVDYELDGYNNAGRTRFAINHAF